MTLHMKKQIDTICKLLRVKHYIKNLLCFIPLLFSMKITEGWGKTKNSVCAFFAFCCVSSVVYIFNDLQDAETDREDPVKKLRPLASGNISTKSAKRAAFVLSVLALAFNYMASESMTDFWKLSSYLLLYMIINVFYSLGLKNKPVLDVFLLASGFMIRVFYGGASIGSGISNWVYLTVLAMSLYFGFGKRRNELKNEGKRKVLEKYPLPFLDKGIQTTFSLMIIFYCLCVTDSNILIVQRGIDLKWTIPIVLYLSFVYDFQLESDGSGDPVELFLKHKRFVILSIILATGIVGQILLTR